ncbi:MAG: hypothetical protein ABFE07_28115 [Armatimonadia bacterium]
MNGYDRSFMIWFRRHGWRIRLDLVDVSIWTNDDTPCPFKVTGGMVERLSAAGEIERFFPESEVCAPFEEFWVRKDRP